MRASIIASLAVLAALCFGSSEGYKVVCYYGSWAVYRPDAGKFDVEAIDPTLCTHLIYTFVGIGEEGTVKVLDPWNDLEDNWGKGAFKRFIKLKEKNPQVKVLIAIGGWNEGGQRFSSVVASDSKRATFVANVVAFLKKYNFDGFDLDWEYPTDSERGGHREDYANFAKLVRELRAAFDKYGYELTAAVAAARTKAAKCYDPAAMSLLDAVHVMAYDLHGAWEHNTGQNAPLNPSSIDTNKELNVKDCIEGWIALGVPRSKLVLGMGTYGRSFTLASSSNHELGAPTYGGGEAGPYTRQMGMIGYNEIVEWQRAGRLTEVWDDQQKVPYVYNGNYWAGYDNVKSIGIKCDYLKEQQLAGAMIWSVETDDFHGLSGETFPLLKTINRALGRL